MEIAGAGEGLRLETREGSDREERGKKCDTCTFRHHLYSDALLTTRQEGGRGQGPQTGPKTVAPQLQVLGQRPAYVK